MLLFFIAAHLANAQQKDTITTQAGLTGATVYYGYGAELQHSSKATLVNGMQQVVISNIALQPDINTLQVACPENVTILSYYHRIFTPTIPPTPPIPPSKSYDTIKILQKRIGALRNQYSIQEDVLRRISALIDNNFTTPDKQNISSAELIKLTNYYTAQVKDIRDKLYDLDQQRIELDEKVRDISNRINATQVQQIQPELPKPTGQLIMQVLAKGAGTVDFDLSYYTRNAGWVPTYDIRVKTIDNSFKLVYKAMLSQSTGLNWNAVKLNLSTSNPNQGTTLPAISPLQLQLYVPVLYNSIQQNNMTNYSVPVMADAAKLTLAEVKDVNTTGAISTVSNFTTLKESQLNTNFEIDLPYDIPSDGNAYSVTIKDEKVPVTYQHFAIPKVDKDAFLMAQLSNWDSLSLMPGQANIIMDNVYLGKSYLDPNTTADTLNLSLGRDKRIAINRKLIKEYIKTSKGDTKTEMFTYEITVKNNKKQAVAMALKDQYPISKVKEIEVTVTDNGKPDEVSEMGIMTWDIKLQPGESRKIRFSYRVKYPKDKILQEIR